MSADSSSSSAAVRAGTARRQEPFLVLLNGPEEGERRSIGDGISIGRSSQCDLTLTHQLVSRNHAEIAPNGSMYMVRDLGSVNGTYLNGRLVSSAELQDGDQITVGDFTLRFNLAEEMSPSTDGFVVMYSSTPKKPPIRLHGEPAALQESLLSTDAERAERARVRLETLVGVTQNLARLRELEVLYPMVVDEVMRILPAERVALFRTTPDGQLEPQVARHAKDPDAAVEVSRTILDEVASNRICVLSADAVSDREYDDSASIMLQNIRSVLCVPIESKSELYGVLYLDAPGKEGAFTEDDLHFVSGVASVAAVSMANAMAVDAVRSTAQELNRAYLSMLAVLANAIEARDHYTIGHTWRVARFAQAIAGRLGWASDKINEIEVGGVLHDIGKIGVPDSILTKAGPLSRDEEEQMMLHPETGARMLRDVPSLRHVLPYVLHHHECYDGTGYPHRLSEQAIPIEARLLAVADALDAMTSDRPYRAGLDPGDAMAEIRENSGSQFDPVIVEALFQAYEAGELDPYLQAEPVGQRAVICPHCSTSQTPGEDSIASGATTCPTCNRTLRLFIEGRLLRVDLA
jgi:HD-GYP domain-containing protein (c-di-GMP phosphodiesterase class II)